MRSRTDCPERGMALPLVLIIIACFVIIAFSFLAVFGGRTRQNAANINKNTADYVAEVGLNQYLWNLNQDDNFWKNNLTLAGYYPDANGYYYVIATPPNPPANLYLTLNCTGWLAKDPTNTFSFTAQVTKRTFTQYIMATNWDLVTPSNGTVNTSYSPDWVWWTHGDEAHGRVYTNGVFYFNCDPKFDDYVQYAGNTNPPSSQPASCYYQGSPPPIFVITSPPQPQLVPQMTFPASNGELITWSDPNNGGYYFNGRTSIELLPNGTMNVVNYDCNQYVMNGLTPKQPLQANPNYHKYVTNMGLGHPLPLPADGVIYVDGLQDAAYNDNNYSSAGSSTSGKKFNPQLGNVFVSGSLKGQLTIAAANNIYITGSDPTAAPPANQHQSGGVTYASTTFDSSGNVTNGGTDMLGLIANNYVMILRFGWPSYDNSNGYDDCTTDYSPYDVNVDAAIMAVNYSWQYEGWSDSVNPQDKINLVGSIIQYFRGAVGQFSGSTILDGYNKNYYHDSRMNTGNPPHFLDPTSSGWGVLTWRRTTPPAISGFNGVIVPNAPIQWHAVTGISVTSAGGATSVYAGQTLQMYATLTPADATINTVVWSVANSGGANATIDPYTGLLRAGTHNGSVVVTATSQDASRMSASMSITINIIPVSSVTVDTTPTSGVHAMFTGQTLQMNYAIQPPNASVQTVQWSVSDSGGANATIDPNTGLLTAGTSAGTATVTATSTDGYATSLPYNVTITVPVSGITVSGYGGATYVAVGNTLQMIATVTPANASNQAVTWWVGNYGGTNATITTNGLLYAGTVRGTVVVTATAQDGSGVSGTASINIVAVPTVTGISPKKGPASGGTSVTITGTNFCAPASVNFGAASATGVVVKSSTSITCTSPAGTGTVDVRVTNPAGTSATSSADHFTYY